MNHPLFSLFSSRKGVITFTAVLACTILLLLGKLPLEHFVDVVASLVAVLTGAIALEDHGKKPPPPDADSMEGSL